MFDLFILVFESRFWLRFLTIHKDPFFCVYWDPETYCRTKLAIFANGCEWLLKYVMLVFVYGKTRMVLKFHGLLK